MATQDNLPQQSSFCEDGREKSLMLPRLDCNLQPQMLGLFLFTMCLLYYIHTTKGGTANKSKPETGHYK